MCVWRALHPLWWRPSTATADERALAEAARKVEAVGGSVKLVLKRLPEEV